MTITWRNVGMPQAGGAGVLLHGAAQSLNRGFQDLRGALTDYDQGVRQQADATRTINTQAFLDRLSSYRDPAALQAAIQSGEVDAFRQQLGPLINQDAVRGAAEQRVASLQDQTLKQNLFADDIRQRSERGIRDQAVSAAAQGNQTLFRQLLDGNDLLNEGELEGMWVKSERERAQESRAVKQDQRAEESLGMQRTRFNQQTQDWNENQALKGTAREVSELLRSQVQARAEQEDANWKGYESVAQGMADQGVRLVNGVPDFSGVPEESRAAVVADFSKRAEEAGVKPLASPTELRRQMVDTLSQYKNLPVEKIAPLADNFLATLSSRNALAPEDQAVLDNAIKVEQGNYQEQLKNDPFTKTEFNPARVTTELMDQATGKDWDPVNLLTFESTLRDGLKNKINESLTSGIEVTGEDGAKTRIPIPPDLAKLVISGQENITAEDYEKGVRDLLSRREVLEQVKRGQNVHTNHANQVSALREQFLGAKGVRPFSLEQFERSLKNANRNN